MAKMAILYGRFCLLSKWRYVTFTFNLLTSKRRYRHTMSSLVRNVPAKQDHVNLPLLCAVRNNFLYVRRVHCLLQFSHRYVSIFRRKLHTNGSWSGCLTFQSSSNTLLFVPQSDIETSLCILATTDLLRHGSSGSCALQGIRSLGPIYL